MGLRVARKPGQEVRNRNLWILGQKLRAGWYKQDITKAGHVRPNRIFADKTDEGSWLR